MKKYILSYIFFALCCINSVAQEAETSDSVEATVVLLEDNDEENYQTQSGADIMYHSVEEWGLGIDICYHGLVLGLDFLQGKIPEGVSETHAVQVYLGGNYRYHVNRYFYVEGRILMGYYTWTKTNRERHSSVGKGRDDTNRFFVGLSPRIGIDFGHWGISAGYRLDVTDIHFSKDRLISRFNLGISIGI